MSATRPELVCFDLGGVLVRICTVWSDLCRATRLEVRGDSAGDAAERSRRELSEAYMRGELSTEAWTHAMETALGGFYVGEEIAALHDAVILEEYPGIGVLIDDLHRAGVATACLSNTNETHWAKLVHHDGARTLPGEPRYPAVRRLHSHHASHLLRHIKPAPAIYLAFEKAVGRSGAQILFFDDLEENVAAARRAGWRAETIDPSEPTDEQLRRHLAAHGVL
ncbi:MAG TPA: HAD-IA family hydrolase [Polyangiaceae bacterium]|nr:HAD-IA family hydrolase [Polyangiaceae bacterium]